MSFATERKKLRMEESGAHVNIDEGIQKENKTVTSEDSIRHNWLAVTAQAADTTGGVSLAKTNHGETVLTHSVVENRANTEVSLKSDSHTPVSNVEEQIIANWIKYRAEIGCLLTDEEIVTYVQKYIILQGKKGQTADKRLIYHWYKLFEKRYPNLPIKRLQHSNSSGVDNLREDVREWFDELGRFLISKNLLDISPDRVFICSSTNFPMCPYSQRNISSSVLKAADGGKKSLAVLFMVNAAGAQVPPTLLYAYKTGVPKTILLNTPGKWGIGISETGCVNEKVFFEYMANIFHEWLLQQKITFPVIVYLDNLSPYISIPLMQFCQQQQIEVRGFLQSSHILEPLENSFFYPLKEIWRLMVIKWKTEKNMKRLTKEDFPVVLMLTISCMTNSELVIRNAFKESGIVPFNCLALNFNLIKRKREDSSSHVVKDPEMYENEILHLDTFERNVPRDLLTEFHEALSSGSWSGADENKGLFKYWLMIRNLCGNVDIYRYKYLNFIELLTLCL